MRVEGDLTSALWVVTDRTRFVVQDGEHVYVCVCVCVCVCVHYVCVYICMWCVCVPYVCVCRSMGFEEETWVVTVGNEIVGDRDGLACNAVLVCIVDQEPLRFRSSG